MNIFFLAKSPIEAATYHVDLHVTKMITEYAQIMSTVHRFYNGALTEVQLERNDLQDSAGKPLVRKKAVRVLPGEKAYYALEINESSDSLKLIYDAHVDIKHKRCFLSFNEKHPSVAWALRSKKHYSWLYDLYWCCNIEYVNRREHDRPHQAYEPYYELLSSPPHKMPDIGWVDPPQAMPPVYKRESAVQGYRRYYIGDKYRFAKWKGDDPPRWFLDGIGDVWGDDRLAERLQYIANPANRSKMHPLIIKTAQKCFGLEAKDMP